MQNSTSSKLGVTFYKNSILVKTVELDLKEEYATTYVNKTETAAIGEYIFKADSLVISRLGSSIFYIDCKKGGDCAKRTPFSFISYKNIDDKSFIYSITDADFK